MRKKGPRKRNTAVKTLFYKRSGQPFHNPKDPGFRTKSKPRQGKERTLHGWYDHNRGE